MPNHVSIERRPERARRAKKHSTAAFNTLRFIGPAGHPATADKIFSQQNMECLSEGSHHAIPNDVDSIELVEYPTNVRGSEPLHVYNPRH